MYHPVTTLSVEVRQIPELTQGQEVALHILHARLDDPLLSGIRRRTSFDAKSKAFGALGIRALHDRIVHAGPGDRGLGVVDDQSARNPTKPLEGAAVAAQ